MIQRTVLSLEERLECLKNGRASTPEAAAAKLKRISQIPFSDLIHDGNDLDLLFDTCGLEEYADCPGVDIDHYYQFCNIYRYLLADAVKDSPGKFLHTKKNVQFVNAMLMLASMFMDKTKNKKSNLYCALNMSLNDYWTAAIDICVDDSGKRNLKRRELLINARNKCIGRRNPDVTLKSEIGYMLNQYLIGWELFAKLQEVLKCDAALQERLSRDEIFESIGDVDDCDYDCDETEDTGSAMDDLDVEDGLQIREQSEDCEIPLSENLDCSLVDEYNLQIDPAGHYLDQLSRFRAPIHDFMDERVKYIRESVMFTADCYSPDALNEMRKKLNYTCFQAEFDKIVESKEFEVSYRICETVSIRIYRLLVLPFLGIEHLHYEGALEHEENK